jgi:hypothetical protein
MGFDELIDPRETRDALLASLIRGLSSRQAAGEPDRHHALSSRASSRRIAYLGAPGVVVSRSSVSVEEPQIQGIQQAL